MKFTVKQTNKNQPQTKKLPRNSWDGGGECTHRESYEGKLLNKHIQE